MAHKNKHSRRNFLKTMGCASMSVTPFLSTITNLGLINAAAINNMPYFSSCGGYKALVCLALDGGNDSYNMLIPNETATYNEYANTRSNLAINQNELLSINSSGTTYGLNPSMPNIRNLYNSGNAAFVANVGTLIRPTTLSDYNNLSNLPVGLFSHLDQLQTWQTSIPQERSDIGWGGKMADILASQCNNSSISMNISVNGFSTFLNGIDNTGFTASFSSVIDGINDIGWNKDAEIKINTINSLIDQGYQNILKRGYADKVNNAKSGNLEYLEAINSAPPIQTAFPATPSELNSRFETIAKTISARNILGMQRQIFYITLGGFDTHGSGEPDSINIQHNALLEEVDTALKTFWDAMTDLNLTDQVTLFTISDFGRTLTSNNNGTDHAWGGNAMVMGGAVNGGKIYGEYPSLALGSDLDTGEGRLIPTTSCDEYFAELALWFAHNGTDTLSDGQLDNIFPNLHEFWSYQTGQKPLNFMN